jgi:hypothetical protein
MLMLGALDALCFEHLLERFNENVICTIIN